MPERLPPASETTPIQPTHTSPSPTTTHPSPGSPHASPSTPTPFQVALFSRIRQNQVASSMSMGHIGSGHANPTPSGGEERGDHKEARTRAEPPDAETDFRQADSHAVYFSAALTDRIRHQLRRHCECEEHDGPEAHASESKTVEDTVPVTHTCICNHAPRHPSFLDRVQQRLTEHADRILAEHNGIAPAPRVLSTHAFVPDEHTMKQLFRERHGTSLDALVDQLEQVVEWAIRDYESFFAEECQILAVAEWSEELERQRGGEDTTRTEGGCCHDAAQTPEWIDALQHAQTKWNRLQASRYALKRCEQLFGGSSGCRICFDTPADTVLVPCGHVLCADCAKRVRTCPFCNAAFRERQAVYF